MRYLLLVTVGTVLFIGAYWLLMRRETRFTMVRFYLLGTLLLALLLPLVHIPMQLPLFSHNEDNAATIQEPIPLAESVSMTFSSQESGTIDAALQLDIQENSPLGIQMADTYQVLSRRDKLYSTLTFLYLVGCGIMLTLLVVRLLKLRSRLRRLPYRTVDGIKISELDDDTPAYSFGNHIVLGRNGFSAMEMQQLIGHEMVHVRQRHTLDLLLCELAKALLWFNPFVWLYERELKRVHEYIADHKMLATDQGADYAALFYHQVSGKPYCAIGSTFDYHIVRQRIRMMAQRRSRRGWLKPLIALPLVAVVLVAGCKQEGTLQGFYAVGNMALMSDNPDEPTLNCTEFLGLENRLFAFHRDGLVHILDRQEEDSAQLCTYTIDDNGLHLFDSSGRPWLDMQLETVSLDGDSIVLRFVDPDPISGLGKMLAGIPPYRYRIDTVNVSTTNRVGDEIIEVSEGIRCDTVFAHVVAPTQWNGNDSTNWHDQNRLLEAAKTSMSTFATEYKTYLGKTVREFGTSWEFHNNALAPDARERYDTLSSYYTPRLDGDRFILQVTLKKVKK